MSPHPTNLIMPHLTVSDGAAAIAFYETAFWAKPLFRAAHDDGKRLMHAAVEINGAVVMLHDDFPEWTGGQTPEKFGGSPVVIHIEVSTAADVDAWHARAVAAGATPVMEPEDMFWGDRYAKITDPFGHSWAIAAPAKA